MLLARHRALPRLVDHGSDGDGSFLIETTAPGVSLESMLDAADGPIDRELATTIVRDAAIALDEVHSLCDEHGPLGLVHGDPSPANVFFDTSRGVTFVDFGGSRHRDSMGPMDPARGTIPYSSPELVRGETDVSRGTDVYALAAMAVALFAGPGLTRAEAGAPRLLEIARCGVSFDSLTRAKLPASLEGALRALLAFDAAARASSLEPLLAALEE